MAATATALVGTVSSIAMALKGDGGLRQRGTDPLAGVFQLYPPTPVPAGGSSAGYTGASTATKCKPAELTSLYWSYATLGIDMQRRKPRMYGNFDIVLGPLSHAFLTLFLAMYPPRTRRGDVLYFVPHSDRMPIGAHTAML